MTNIGYWTPGRTEFVEYSGLHHRAQQPRGGGDELAELPKRPRVAAGEPRILARRADREQCGISAPRSDGQARFLNSEVSPVELNQTPEDG